MHHEIRMKARRVLRAAAAVALASVSVAAVADGHRAALPDGPGKQAYTSECASCHVAYPPRLLAAGGWNRVMTTLDKHFGVDASLDAATAKSVGAYLSANAGSDRRFGADTTRITETAWFKREHDEVPARVWTTLQKRTSARTDPAATAANKGADGRGTVHAAADCAACHTGADRGDYSERGIRMPGG